MAAPTNIVRAAHLGRSFRVARHRPGIWGGLLGLVWPEYRTVEAVRGVSFAIARGEFVGVVGPNGAGKSTTLKMLTGILAPTAGEIEVCGTSPHSDRTTLARRLGVVFGQRTLLWWDLSAREGFALLRTMYQIDRGVFAQRLGTLRERLSLDAFLDTPIRKLSLGQKMRCELAAALLHDPELLLLDEPTIGLDLVAKDALHGFLRELNAEGRTTVVLTSHDLDDIEQLCRRVLVIDRGRLLHDGSLAELSRRAGHERRLELWFRSGAVPIAGALPEGARIVEVEGRCARIAFDEGRIGAPALLGEVLRICGPELVDLTVQQPGIEDVIRLLYTTGYAGDSSVRDRERGEQGPGEG